MLSIEGKMLNKKRLLVTGGAGFIESNLWLTEDDPTKRQPDISIARKVLVWKPSINLETGLIRTIEYFNQK